MKLGLPIFFLLIFSFSCKNEIKVDNSIDEKISVIYEPIFLNLSPKMDGIRFYEELNKNPSINDGFFHIFLNEKTTPFKVSKLQDRILLEYADKKQHSSTTNPYTLSNREQAYTTNKKTVQEFIDLFKSKYGKPVSILPFEVNDKGEYLNSESRWKNALNPNSRRKEYANGIENKKLYDYDFDKYFYLIFKDSFKTIMIGYENSNSDNFGIALEINYFHNSDFLALQKKMEKDKFDFEYAEFNKEQLKRQNQNTKEGNRKKI